MIEPLIPADDAERVAALDALRILDTPPEERFDRLTRLATHVFDVPIALVSLVDADRQWFKSCVGIDSHQTDRSISFCGHAINEPITFVVEDASLDERFADNPLVTGEPFVRFYAGHPLTTVDGHRVGMLCIIDRKPRTFDDQQRGILREFAALAEAELRQHELNQVVAHQNEAEERVRVVAESVADVIVAIDLRGRIVFANGPARVLFGDTPDAPLVGRPAAQVVSDRSPGEIAALIAKAESGDPSERLEVLAKSESGGAVPLDVTFAPAHLDGQRVYIASGRDLTEQRRARRELERISQQQELILASSADGIVHIDQDGVVVYANPSAHRMLHRPDNWLQGKHLHSVTHHADVDGRVEPWVSSPVWLTLAVGEVVSAQRDTFDRSDGQPFPVSFTSAPVTEDGVVTGAVVVFADVSEQAEIERSKDEFVSLVSHELRTPLTSLKGSLGLVTGGVFGALPEEAHEMLLVAVTNTDRLVRLVNDILDLQRVDAGRLQLHVQPHRLVELVSDSVATVSGLYTDRGVLLANLVAMQEDLDVLCDGDRIVQVLTNLLGNAAKFSPAGSTVTVTSFIETDAFDGAGYVVIEVADRGRGIPPERLERIFERFEQVDSSDARHGSGSGLGLAIARVLVEMHGGRLTVTSEPGVGSVFSVTLPAAGPVQELS
jgi:PAS domain S-box-containing protein